MFATEYNNFYHHFVLVPEVSLEVSFTQYFSCKM